MQEPCQSVPTRAQVYLSRVILSYWPNTLPRNNGTEQEQTSNSACLHDTLTQLIADTARFIAVALVTGLHSARHASSSNHQDATAPLRGAPQGLLTD
jgi:hypothetical protein